MAKGYVRRLVDVLSTGEGRNVFGQETARVRDTPWWPLVRVPAKDNLFWSDYRRIGNYDAEAHWRRVKVPVLMTYGERDLYVPVGATIARLDAAPQIGGEP